MDVEWVDELPSSSRGPREANPEELELVAQLKANPGRWAKFKELDSSSSAGNLAGSISKGTRAAFRNSGIEAKSRRLPTKIQQGTGEEQTRYAVFVRFPG